MMKILALMWLLWPVVRGDGTEQTITTKQFEITTNSPPLNNINKYETPIKLNKLSDNGYGIKSDNVLILNDKTISIPNFHYNGNALDAHISIGNGSQPHGNGIIIPDFENLPSYNGQDLIVKLPDDSTIHNTDWLAIWCLSDQKSLAHVFINLQQFEYPPQTSGFQDIVKSGPIVLVNKKTLFIPNLVYNGDYLDAHFWAGNGTEPTSDGNLVPDEYGSVENLGNYQHENIYVNLPDGITTDNIEYFAVWSRDTGGSLGHVKINNVVGVPETIGFEKQTSDGKIIMRVPKCCPMSTIPSSTNCTYDESLKFQPTLYVYKHNATHLDNDTMDVDNFKYEPYVYPMVCPSVKYALGDDYENVALLLNGSLIVAGTGLQGILSQGDYCLDLVEDDDDHYSVHALVCAPDNKISQAMFGVYTSLLVISIICFAGISILYWFILGPADVHKKCFLCYSSWMCVTFIFLAIAQIAYIETVGCAIIGFFFQFSMISSFTWLAILCFDIDYMLKCTLSFVGREETQNRAKTNKRFIYYLIGSILVPVVSIIISLSRNQVPDVPDSFFKPQYGRNTCYFNQEYQRLILFYVPIMFSICLCIFYLIWARIKIIDGDKNYQYNYFWIEDGKPYKLMHRRYIIMLIPMLIWLIEGIAALGGPNDGIKTAFDIIEASQGIFIFILFVLNEDAKQQILKAIQKQKNKRNGSSEDFSMKTFLPNSNNMRNSTDNT